MQMVKKIFIALAVIWFALLVFMPKQMLYYKLEQELANNAIKINEKSMDEGIFSFTVHQADVYAKGIKLASVEKIHFFTLLFYTKVTLEELTLDDSLKSMAPTYTKEATATYALWNPLYIGVEAKGSFGGLQGMAKLADKTLRLDFNESKGIEMLKPKLKQDKKGWYYETSF
ncbi:MAG TPA: hypothetical protein ENK98_06270 [Epsilonproteobacteria bacterium]|nr:hypothetical protein [Campylobacterota bacterium]